MIASSNTLIKCSYNMRSSSQGIHARSSIRTHISTPSLLVSPTHRCPLPVSLPPTKTTRKSKDILCPPNASPSAAAAAAVAGQGTLMHIATGVPLLVAFEQISLAQAALQSLGLITATCVLVLFGNKAISALSQKLNLALDDGSHRKRSAIRKLLADLVGAAEQPSLTLLPWFGFTFITMVIAAFVEVAIARTDCKFHFLNICGSQMASSFLTMAQVMQDSSEILVIIFLSWLFVAFKDRIINRTLDFSSVERSIDDDHLARIILPFSTLLNWGTVAIATVSSLHAFGINVRPLLAFGSVSTLAIGFAAQSTVSNLVSAFSLYTSRPFISGDRIQLKSMSGANVVNGTVETIRPMHTVIKTDSGTPIFIHNKDIASSLLVVNESKLTSTTVTPAVPLLDTSITVRMQDVDKIAKIQEEATQFIKSHPDTGVGANKCNLDSFSLYGPVLIIKATLRREASSRKSAVFTDLLIGVERIVRKNGAHLATARGVELAPQLFE